MTALTAQLEPFTTHDAMTAQLEVIAKHLLRYFNSSLSELSYTDHKSDDPETDITVKHLCQAWNAESNTDGACKAFVFVNHQWVVKLGNNAVLEAERYNDVEGLNYRYLIVPTVALGPYGCVQFKITTPANYFADEPDLDWDEWWESEELTARRDLFRDFDDDVHLENCGFINDTLYLLDFGGADLLSCRRHYSEAYNSNPSPFTSGSD